jgi:hypothetical protein
MQMSVEEEIEALKEIAAFHTCGSKLSMLGTRHILCTCGFIFNVSNDMIPEVDDFELTVPYHTLEMWIKDDGTTVVAACHRGGRRYYLSICQCGYCGESVVINEGQTVVEAHKDCPGVGQICACGEDEYDEEEYDEEDSGY